jgi:hexosaminidase
MKVYQFLTLSFLTVILFSCSSKQDANLSNTLNSGIIPAPNNVMSKNKASELKEVKITLKKDMNPDFYQNLISDVKGITLVDASSANVVLTDFKDLETEGYQLTIHNDKIEISASSNTGFQYGLTSLIQMVRHHGFPLPQVVIEDSPKFRYRGMHLDVARHFFGVADVKKYLDYMAYYKFNNFHWHLTEDQGWRIEIKKYPRLQEIAAYRKETLIGHYNDEPHKFDGKRYGGFYTQEEVKDIVAYASARNISVIPEIEMPGHSQAALAAYPELGCENKKYEVATKWGVFEDVYCPHEVTFKFLEDVIDEVITLFPGKYIHIGGDECPKEAWKKSAFCQDLIKKENLKDEHGLQSYFIQRMEKYINSKGKQIIGWDEILEGGLAPNATVMSWRGIEGGLEAARQDHDVIMTPGTHCYFDHYQSESPDEPLAIGGYTTIEKVYHWEPIPDSLAEDKRKYILGGQSNLWSEYIREYSGVEYMVYARGMAMSEALWSRNKDYTAFLPRYLKHNDYWKSKGANMAFHVYDLKPIVDAGKGKPVNISFMIPEGTEVRYSINGSANQKMDTQKPLEIIQNGKYAFTAGKDGRNGKPLMLEFNLHKATSSIITLENDPAKQYSGNGPGSIINGIQGSDEKYGGTEWLGFEGTDAIGVLDFGKHTEFTNVNFRFFKGEGQWIYLPKSVEVFSSEDGKTFTSLKKVDNIKTDTKIARINIDIQSTKSRYLKFVATNYGMIPEGRQGAGHKAWLFIDEVDVK